MSSDEGVRKVFGNRVIELDAGEGVTIDMRGLVRLHVIPGTTATITVSRVDDDDATAHTADTVTAFPHDVDWPFYRVSSAGNTTPTRVAAI